MGVDTNVYNGYGIAILTKNLSKETIQKLEENEIPERDAYSDQDWFFIALGAEKDEKLERGITNNLRSTYNPIFNPKNSQVQASLIPLFLNESSEFFVSEKQRKKAFDKLKEEFDNDETHEEYKKLKIILEENPNSWVPGNYLVIFFS